MSTPSASRTGISCDTFFRTARLRFGSCALILIFTFLSTSCGFLVGLKDGQSSGTNSQNLTISGTLPDGVTSQAYNSVLTVSGGRAPYQFAIKSGSLPTGLNLNSTTGSISGMPTAEGSFAFQVAVTDLPNPHQGTHDFTIKVTKPVGIHVSVTPSSATLVSGHTQAFTAAVTGTSNTGVTWSASPGSIDSTGLYTAPTVTTTTSATVMAISTADTSVKATAAVTVQPPATQNLAITTSSLPDAHMGNAYHAAITATGGTQPYSWSISGGTVPPGLTLTPSNGQISGMPGATGSYNFTVTVHDTSLHSAQKAFAMNVVSGGNFDGPAELPRVTVSSSLADTPAPGTTIPVHAGDDLQAVLNSAQCGDTITLQAGASFIDNFKFPAKNCDDSHWIIVRTSSPDSALPAEGQRITPCYAGVASLPGRPQYPCANPQNVLAKLVFEGGGDGPVILLDGANHYRLIGLEITRPAGVDGSPTLITPEHGGLVDHIVIDRSWLHGTAQDETQNGVMLTGANYVAAVDSYFSDFHCTSNSGTCTDSHALGGGNGDHQGGPYKVENNFLEASGEGFMLGGGAATTTPADVVIRRNHFFKPMQWMEGNPDFVGGPTGDPFVVKNHLELKNASRVLVEANLMENSWGGFSQTGYAILLTPKNQHMPSGDVCPICQVTDVTVRYTQISHGGGGIQMATSISGDGTNGSPAYLGSRWSIHDVVIDDINKDYVGGGTLFELQNGWPENPLNTVTINHITGFPDPGGHLMIMGNLSSNPSMYGFVFTNNIVTTGQYPVWNTGGGPTSCGFSDVPVTVIYTCFTTYQFDHNALVASPPAFPPSDWPDGNFFSDSGDSVGFKNYNGGNGGNYELLPGTPYKSKGTDGHDLGADIPDLEAALAGVE